MADDKARKAFIQSLHDAQSIGSYVNVSNMDRRCKGYVVCTRNDMPSDAHGIRTDIIPIVSDTYTAYHIAMQILGPDYTIYSGIYGRIYRDRSRFSEFPLELTQKILQYVSAKELIDFCTVITVCHDAVFWKNRIDTHFTTTNEDGTVIKPSNSITFRNTQRDLFEIYKSFYSTRLASKQLCTTLTSHKKKPVQIQEQPGQIQLLPIQVRR